MPSSTLTMKPRQIAALLVLAFLFGGSSAEVAVQTSRAVARARAQRRRSVGDLVAFQLLDEDGQVIARPRLIAPLGRAAHLVLRDPLDPETIQLALHIEAAREASGDILLDYALELPGRSVTASGKVSVTPGVERALALGDGPVTGTLLALPVPSAAFDAYLEAEGARHPPPHAI
jgi:hypothetical protein